MPRPLEMRRRHFMQHLLAGTSLATLGCSSRSASMTHDGSPSDGSPSDGPTNPPDSTGPRPRVEELAPVNPAAAPWYAKFDGATDDTVAIQACFDFATAHGRSVQLPEGTALVGPLRLGDQNQSTQAEHPASVRGYGTRTQLRAIAGATGTLLQAWSTAGLTLADFVVDAANQPGLIAIDTSWKAGVGPSLQNVYHNVWVQRYASLGWVADDNNDATFSKCLIRMPVDDNQIALRVRASGGLVMMRDCSWPHARIQIAAQNLEATACWGMGIEFLAGAVNGAVLNGCYLYSSNATGGVITTAGFAAGCKVQHLLMNACWIDLQNDSHAVFDLRVASALLIHVTTFAGGAGVTRGLMFGARCVGDLADAKVDCQFQGGRQDGITLGWQVPPMFTLQRRAFDVGGTLITEMGPTHAGTLNLPSVNAEQWVQIVAPGALSPGSYVASLQWNHDGAGAPYLVRGSALVSCDSVNTANAQAAVAMQTTAHLGDGATLRLRGTAANGQTHGFAVALSFAVAAPSRLHFTFTRLA